MHRTNRKNVTAKDDEDENNNMADTEDNENEVSESDEMKDTKEDGMGTERICWECIKWKEMNVKTKERAKGVKIV